MPNKLSGQNSGTIKVKITSAAGYREMNFDGVVVGKQAKLSEICLKTELHRTIELYPFDVKKRFLFFLLEWYRFQIAQN
jgi:hypothetical protein